MTWRRWHPKGEPGHPRGALAPALVPGTENRPRTPPPPFPSGMLILVQEFPTLPRVPRPSQPCKVTSAAGHLVVITHRGRGLRWAQAVQPPQALGGWSLSSEGAQLLLALISCGDFLTALETPRRLRLWERRWFGKGGRSPQPQLEPPPLTPSGDPVYRRLDVGGMTAGGGGRGRLYLQPRGPLTLFTTWRNPLLLSDPPVSPSVDGGQQQCLLHGVIVRTR